MRRSASAATPFERLRQKAGEAGRQSGECQRREGRAVPDLLGLPDGRQLPFLSGDLLFDRRICWQRHKRLGRQAPRQGLDGCALVPDLGALLAARGVELLDPPGEIRPLLADDDAVQLAAVIEFDSLPTA